MKTKYWVFSLLIFLLLVLSILLWKSDDIFSKKEALYLAVSGPMSGKSKANGEAMLEGIQLYLDNINQQGGIDGIPVKLLIFDDKNQPALAKKNALEIVKNSKALAVIGHYTSSASLAAAPIYQEYGIPAITGTATADKITLGNDWYFRITFNNSDQGAFVANYVRKVLNYETANVIFDEDAYGATLAAKFVQTAKMIGLEVKHQWSFDTKEKNSLKKAIKQMKASEPAILFVATHSSEGVEIVTRLKHGGGGVPIIGADAFSSSNFTRTLSRTPQERVRPGYYSDGIFTTSPFLIDIANERAQDFRHEFLKSYQKEPMMTSAMYYDATMVAIDAIEKMQRQGNVENLKDKRKQMRNNLWQLSRLENAIEGATGYLYFDENGNAIQTIPMGIYKNGRAVVAFVQFQPLHNLRNIENLLQEVLDNHIVRVNGKFMYKARVVYTGLDFNEISNFDINNFTFTADFYLWFRFQRDFNDKNGDFDDKNVEFVNIFDPKTEIGEPILERNSRLDKGVTTRVYRLKTEFKGDFDFKDYPLDQHLLAIKLRHKQLTREKLIYVVDALGMNVEEKLGILPTANNRNQHHKKVFYVNGWQINKLSFFQNTQRTDSSLGIPELFNSQQRIEYSQFNATITIKRYLASFILKNLLPTIFLIILGYLAFFIPISAFTTKLALGTNMIVATSLFHLKLSSELPSNAYLVLIERFFYMVYLLAIFIVAIAVIAYVKKEKEGMEDDHILMRRYNLFGRLFYPLFILLVVGVNGYENYHLLKG
ncbi:ABC transporter substrate-binding protein [Candidatus Parabeggiatoa sp. HSG14]|uniref:ABC transporter substrate-binding protein n=1 Tax=Candidatus Parabeggiatoa sp. HSG14 TaxID=3055593 RepID=UPI0025A772FF|nr:ABC transporter substrate-binding protein [Thiotrichales bacterium HSG14]